MLDVHSYACGEWVPPGSGARPIVDAWSGERIGRAGDGATFPEAMLDHARRVGGPALRALTFHDRARMLKAVAEHLDARKDALYEASYATGATKRDHAFDIDGGIGTTFVYASKGRREMRDAQVHLDGAPETLSKDGSFIGQHVCVPLEGVAVHVNAYNFPVWGMLEKLAPTLLAGVPAIVKPATATSQVTELAVRMILEAGVLPEGALQLAAGGLGDMLDRLGPQDAVAFTGSAATAHALRSNDNLLRNAVRFTAEQDSLNATVLGPDVAPGTPLFERFLKEVVREMTVKAGQKCTAIRRIVVPASRMDEVAVALTERLSVIAPSDPRDPEARMGAIVTPGQRQDVIEQIGRLSAETTRLTGTDEGHLSPTLLRCDDPDGAARVHDTEAFGPVATLMPARDAEHAARIVNRGGGSLVASLVTDDAGTARDFALSAAAWHGRLHIVDAAAMKRATDHGAPMPHMLHGGPGRAGGGEELGGIRAALHYMQRCAIQGSPAMLTAVTGEQMPGAPTHEGPAHPFRRHFEDLAIGESLLTDPREVTLEDIEQFAAFTGDRFYAHMDEAAAAANPFFPGRVAHGYLLLSFAAGLFVDPDPGPVLANTGLESLRFLKPVEPGASVRARLTVKRKTPRTPEYGEVRWAVTLTDADGDALAEYDLLTMVARCG